MKRKQLLHIHEPEYRVCKNCPRRFLVTQKGKEFCSGNCRKNYWRNGGVSFSRLVEQVSKYIREPLREMVREEISKVLTGAQSKG